MLFQLIKAANDLSQRSKVGKGILGSGYWILDAGLSLSWKDWSWKDWSWKFKV